MKCPGCGMIVSVQASECPLCGGELIKGGARAMSRGRKLEAFFSGQEERALLLGVVFILLSLIFWTPLGQVALARSYSSSASPAPLNSVLLGAGGMIILVSLISLLVRKVWYKE